MKQAILVSLFAAAVCGTAVASDGGIFYETETVNKHISVKMDTTKYDANTYVAPSRVVVAARPCARVAAKPVRVKTYTEVIDHYQVYQPVTVYQPVGAYAQRRVVESARPCGCGK